MGSPAQLGAGEHVFSDLRAGSRARAASSGTRAIEMGGDEGHGRLINLSRHNRGRRDGRGQRARIRSFWDDSRFLGRRRHAGRAKGRRVGVGRPGQGVDPFPEIRNALVSFRRVGFDVDAMQQLFVSSSFDRVIVGEGTHAGRQVGFIHRAISEGAGREVEQVVDVDS